LLEGASGAHVLADKGYDADHIVAAIRRMGAEAVIPPRSCRIVQREYNQGLYRERNVIERMFSWLKQFRHFSTRYDKLSAHFESFIYFIFTCLWLK
jgi:transposase